MTDLMRSPFDDHIGTRVEIATPERVVARLDITKTHLQPGGLVHGGIYATLAETVASIGASLEAQRSGAGIAAVGLDNHTSFLRSVGEGARLVAEATPKQTGRHIHAWLVSIRDEVSGKEVAITTMRLYVMAAP